MIDPPGTEWLIDAHECDPARLRARPVLEALVVRIIADLELRAVGPAVWHEFPGAGGITGLVLLAESHLTCHTFPEHRFAALNLYCCRPRPTWPWEAGLREALGAREVIVRSSLRGAAVSVER